MSIGKYIFRSFTPVRQFHLSSRLNIDPKTVQEVRIPVPWGFVAGKWWGSKDIQPILAIHGWLDNAGSWDPFAKELPQNYSLLAIDVPGNGLSSHLPPFLDYNFYLSAPLIKLVKEFYDWDKISLLGHSGGSAMCFIYSTLFPADVKSYFGIDYLIYAFKNNLRQAEKVGKLIDKKIMLSLRDPLKARAYTTEEIVQTWMTATKGSLTETSTRIMMERGITRVGRGKFIYSRDGRLKAPDLTSINVEQAYSLAENLKCNTCLVKGMKSKLFDSGIRDCPNILEIIKNNAKSFNLHELDGDHHLHMDIPQKIAELYVDFEKLT